MSTIEITCHWCGEKKDMYLPEYNRQKKNGQTRFFCDLSCTAKFRNYIREDRKQDVEKTCPWCEERFWTKTGAKSSTFCSRSCASAGSVTAARKNLGSNPKIQNNLKKDRTLTAIAYKLWQREKWKYVKVAKFLDFMEEDHEFEFPLKGTHYIYDLALPRRKLLIEFDGPHHQIDSIYVNEDKKKTKAAKKCGWKVKRIKTPANQVIKASTLYGVLKPKKKKKQQTKVQNFRGAPMC